MKLLEFYQENKQCGNQKWEKPIHNLLLHYCHQLTIKYIHTIIIWWCDMLYLYHRLECFAWCIHTHSRAAHECLQMRVIYHIAYADNPPIRIETSLDLLYTVQFSSKVTFVHVPGTSCTCPRHAPHMFWMCPESGKKGCGSHVSLAAPLSQGFALNMDASCMRSIRMSLARVPDCLACIPDACEHYLGTELYRRQLREIQLWASICKQKPHFTYIWQQKWANPMEIAESSYKWLNSCLVVIASLHKVY